MEPKDNHQYEFYSLITKRTIDAKMPGFIFAHNEPIDLGEGFFVSVQASDYHYCDPTETYDDLTMYTAFEVGIFRHVDKSATHGVLIINEKIQLMDYSINHDFIYEEALNGNYISGKFAVPDCSVIVITFASPLVVQAIIDEVRLIVRKIQSRTVLVEKFISKPMISY